jgi:hypothetical protein
MRVVFHIISTGGGGGASRTTRYVSERDKDPTREGHGPRPLFSEDRNGLTYRNADRILDHFDGQPQKEDLIHLSVSFLEADFDKLGHDEEERLRSLREVVREGMRGLAEEMNVTELVWVAGIHRNTENPHAHIIVVNEMLERFGMDERRFDRLRTSLLPHKQMIDGREAMVPGRIGERFLTALDKQQENVLNPDHTAVRGREEFEEARDRMRRTRHDTNPQAQFPSRDDKLTRQFKERRSHGTASIDQKAAIQSWNKYANPRTTAQSEYRLALGRYLELSIKLEFAETWHQRAVKYGETYRFEVIDQSIGEERKISEFDVRRRASARAQRVQPLDRAHREKEFEAELSRHRETIDQLLEAQEAKIAALGKDVGALRGTVTKVSHRLNGRDDTPSDRRFSPIISRETLSSLESNAVRLNLPDTAAHLEGLRLKLAKEFNAPIRTDDESATLAAQLNAAGAELLARNARLESFEASHHLTPFEVHGERWSLGALDKQIARREQDSRFAPDRSLRLDLRSLTRFNYSPAQREKAAADIAHLRFVRGEIVREIEQRREPLTSDRDRAMEILDSLEESFERDKADREYEGKEVAEPKYEAHQIRSLESSAEILRDPKLLTEVHELEKQASRGDSETEWQGRAVAREIMAGIAVDETKQRLQHFLDSKRVASLNLGDYHTGTLREVEARTLTDYLARLLESREQRDYRHTVSTAAKDHHARLVSDFEKARDYHNTARSLASEAHGHEAIFTDKERINLEIYAERQNDETIRGQFLEMARGETVSEREVAVSRDR